MMNGGQDVSGVGRDNYRSPLFTIYRGESQRYGFMYKVQGSRRKSEAAARS